jgi:hypothetical protein
MHLKADNLDMVALGAPPIRIAVALDAPLTRNII